MQGCVGVCSTYLNGLGEDLGIARLGEGFHFGCLRSYPTSGFCR